MSSVEAAGAAKLSRLSVNFSNFLICYYLPPCHQNPTVSRHGSSHFDNIALYRHCIQRVSTRLLSNGVM